MAAGAGLALLCAPGAVAETVSPLPASDYGVRSVCAATAPRQAQCLSRQLVPRTAAARAHTHPLGMTRAGPVPARSPAAGDFGLRPQDLHSAYELPAASSSTQTIAIVDAYNDPSAEADLAEYSQEFGLPSCTTANGCFQKVYASGVAPFPKTLGELEKARKGTVAEREKAQLAEGWALEISLDIEVAHAVCPNCHVLLVEASSQSFERLEQAEQVAITSGATEISNSWGGSEAGETPVLESSSPFNHPGIVITASAGDNGYRNWDAEGPAKPFTEFPASSPHVVAVGGTRLASLGAGGAWTGESVWNGSGAGGGGCSEAFDAQPWQQGVADWSGVGCGPRRAVADVSADADPYTGVAVHDSNAQCQETIEGQVVHWCTIGGTSLASPLIASVFALAGGAAGVNYPAKTLYENQIASPSSLHDVLNGSNGACAKGFDATTGISACTPAEEAQASCASQLICLAAPGYDGPSGVGTPHGISAFQLAPPGEERPHSASSVPQPSPAPVVAPPAEGPSSPGAGGSAGTGTPPPPSAPVIVISGVSLTPSALLSLHHARVRPSQLGFAFVINIAARVRVTLARRVRVRGRMRWQTLRGSLTLTAASGRNRRRLAGRGILSRGVYRLTLAPAGGTARSIVFHVR
jgi:Subtilase family